MLLSWVTLGSLTARRFCACTLLTPGFPTRTPTCLFLYHSPLAESRCALALPIFLEHDISCSTLLYPHLVTLFPHASTHVHLPIPTTFSSADLRRRYFLRFMGLALLHASSYIRVRPFLWDRWSILRQYISISHLTVQRFPVCSHSFDKLRAKFAVTLTSLSGSIWRGCHF